MPTSADTRETRTPWHAKSVLYVPQTTVATQSVCLCESEFASDCVVGSWRRLGIQCFYFRIYEQEMDEVQSVDKWFSIYRLIEIVTKIMMCYVHSHPAHPTHTQDTCDCEWEHSNRVFVGKTSSKWFMFSHTISISFHPLVKQWALFCLWSRRRIGKHVAFGEVSAYFAQRLPSPEIRQLWMTNQIKTHAKSRGESSTHHSQVTTKRTDHTMTSTMSMADTWTDLFVCGTDARQFRSRLLPRIKSFEFSWNTWIVLKSHQRIHLI